MVATREMEKTTKETNGGAREHMGHREISKSPSTIPATYRRGMTTNWSHEPFRRMREEFDRMFEQFFGNWPAISEGSGRPIALGSAICRKTMVRSLFERTLLASNHPNLNCKFAAIN